MPALPARPPVLEAPRPAYPRAEDSVRPFGNLHHEVATSSIHTGNEILHEPASEVPIVGAASLPAGPGSSPATATGLQPAPPPSLARFDALPSLPGVPTPDGDRGEAVSLVSALATGTAVRETAVGDGTVTAVAGNANRIPVSDTARSAGPNPASAGGDLSAAESPALTRASGSFSVSSSAGSGTTITPTGNTGTAPAAPTGSSPGGEPVIAPVGTTEGTTPTVPPDTSGDTSPGGGTVTTPTDDTEGTTPTVPPDTSGDTSPGGGTVTTPTDNTEGTTPTVPPDTSGDTFPDGGTVTTPTDNTEGTTPTVPPDTSGDTFPDGGAVIIPDLTPVALTGLEDTALALDFGLGALAPGESLSLTVSGLSADASLSAGTANADGSWTLTGDQLAGLTLTAAEPGGFTLSVDATVTDGLSGTTATTSATLPVEVLNLADAPDLTPVALTGLEDTALALDFGLGALAPGESVSLTVSGLSADASLSAGTANADGSWTLTGDQLAGLTLTAAEPGGFTLSVDATVTDGLSGTTATTSATLPVEVLNLADAPDLAPVALTGLEDTALALDFDPAADVSLSAGPSEAADPLPSGDPLAGLTLTAAADGSFTLAVDATVTDSLSDATVAADAEPSVAMFDVSETVTPADLPPPSVQEIATTETTATFMPLI